LLANIYLKIILPLFILTLALTFFACNPNAGGPEYFKDVKEVSVGGSHTVAIKTDGTLWAWGYNDDGQLGDGTTTDSNIPVKAGTAVQQVQADWKWKAVSACLHTVAIKEDDTLWAWGNNSDGQLGDDTSGSGTNKRSPVKVGTTDQQAQAGWKWKAVSACWYHTVAIKEDGTLWAWGGNSNGQLGIGNISQQTIPVSTGTDKWRAVFTGGNHTIALKDDGVLWSWGGNSFGQLGDATTIDRLSPVRVIVSGW